MLYVVRFAVEIVADAMTPGEAHVIAQANLGSEADNARLISCKVATYATLPRAWDIATPYGLVDGDDRTCQEILGH